MMKTLFLLCVLVAVASCKTTDVWKTEVNNECFNIIHDSHFDKPPKPTHLGDRAKTTICCKNYKWPTGTTFPKVDSKKGNEYNQQVILDGFGDFIGMHECTMKTKFTELNA